MAFYQYLRNENKDKPYGFSITQHKFNIHTRFDPPRYEHQSRGLLTPTYLT